MSKLVFCGRRHIYSQKIGKNDLFSPLSIESFLYCCHMAQISDLVKQFYLQLWNQRDYEIANQILQEQVNFRGSLGPAMVGRDRVCEYVKSVTDALQNYTCEIQEIVVDGQKAAAKVLFRGIHVGQFMGFEPTGKEVNWLGAAFFESDNGMLTNIWVLGDIQGLLKKLEQNKG